MATRKIRLTMSGRQVDDQGPIVDIDFNGVNLDADIDVNAVYGDSTLVKEYTVDVAAGVYNLDIDFKNDSNVDDADRNLYIESIEYANDGVNYESLAVIESNTTLELWKNFPPMGWIIDESNRHNPGYIHGETRTDEVDSGYIPGTHPGSNPKYQYNFIIRPITIWEAGTSTINITFS